MTSPEPSQTAAPALLATPTDRPDWTRLEEVAPGQPAFAASIISTFLSQVPELVEALQAATAAADWSALAQLAHKLRGQVAYFGLDHLHLTLSELERDAKTAPTDFPTAPDRVKELVQRLHALVPTLTEHHQVLLAQAPVNK